ncbi:MAG: hypothetical protein E6J34_21810 [Chloroflexi bacterium]|nr:MAG: hypothetical protein E6J34_21810 [Chloroflexota bacterium]
MADVELTQGKSEVAAKAKDTVTASGECSNAVFAPGNKIVDPALLERLQETEPLTPTDATKLAVFLSAYPGNRCLTEHLALFASISIVSNRRVQQTLQKITSPQTLVALEDLGDWGCDDPEPEDSSRCHALFVLPLPSNFTGVPSLALVVESSPSDVDEKEISYFAIGVSLNPADLSLPSD